MSMEEFQEYLLKSSKTKDGTIVREHIIPQIKRQMIHKVLALEPYLKKGKTYFEVSGVDYMVDSSFNVWFIEMNRGPAWSEIRVNLKERLLHEMADFIDAKMDGKFTTKELPYRYWEPIIDKSLPRFVPKDTSVFLKESVSTSKPPRELFEY
eukprot:CAMPEP_0115032148 /NCGR_PEP_ID=MMETSP0216-20121206/38985_1 /TAXON_ID=223996 /ORGANISM="Protocruzia adherens, Strain Boccale" /LENGTH=151 /DNA_ID=CAMNT_0002409991 /DNA_START=554 /DNA_END=1009 /DNA_ORIENTATION=-